MLSLWRSKQSFLKASLLTFETRYSMA